MELHNLKPAQGATHKRRRIGRGQGSGYGGTSTRGHKGAQSRSGYKRRFGFEGGQQPLQRRVPKLGLIKPISKPKVKAINLDRLQLIIEKSPTDTLKLIDMQAKGLLKSSERLKILGRGTLKAKISIEAHAFSKSAQVSIEKQGGKVVTIT